VASKFAKRETKKIDEAKTLFESHLRLTQKVHIALCKYLRKTVLDGGKSVDTSLIGIFKHDPTLQVKYYPCPRFFETGKFKPAKWLL